MLFSFAVTRGIIQRVQPVDDETDLSEIVVKETKRLRSSGLEWGGENEVVDRTMVGVARHCGAAHGEGEMVIMARRKLGRLVLVCAPRHSEWHAIVRQPAVRDAAHCLLASWPQRSCKIDWLIKTIYIDIFNYKSGLFTLCITFLNDYLFEHNLNCIYFFLLNKVITMFATPDVRNKYCQNVIILHHQQIYLTYNEWIIILL